MSRAWWTLSAALLLALPWNEIRNDPTGLAIVHLIALAALLVAPTAPRLPLAGGFGAGWLLALVAWGALSALRPGNRFSAALEVWDQWIPALWLVTMAHVPMAAPARRRLAGILVLGAGAHAAWALVQRLSAGERTGGAFVNPNFLAAHLNIALPVALWLMLEARGGRRRTPGTRAFGAVLALILVATLFATGSRGGLLGTAAALAAILPWGGLVAAARRHPRRAALVALLLAAGLAAGGALWARSRALGSDPYRYQRVQIWRQIAALWGERFWAGTAPGQLQWIAPAYNFPLEDRPFRYSRVWTSAHSTPLQLAAEEGMIALALAAAFVIALARALGARARTAGGGPARAALAALAGLCAHALVDTPLDHAAVGLSLATLAGLALAPALPGAGAGAAERGGPARPLASRAGAAGLVALAVAAWGAVVSPGVAHLYQRRFHREEDPRRALQALQSAVRFNPYQHAYLFQLGRIAWTARGDLNLRRVAVAELLLERASGLNPNDGRAERERGRVMTQAALAGILPSDSALRAALRRYEKAGRRWPLDPIVRQEAALAALRLGDFARARAEAEAALALEPNFLDARLLLADAALRAGQPAGARAALEGFRAARKRLRDYAPANEYEEVLLKYNDAVSGRLERELAR